jgi:hypothetical protein
MQEQKTRTLKTKQTEVSKEKKGVAAKGRTSVASARAPKIRKSTLSDAVAKPSRTPAIKAKPAQPKAKAVTPKVKKAEKPKLIRDSFKFPEAEYQAFDALKARCLQQGLAAKKSELVRAGLQALAALTDEALAAQVAGVEKLKTGRPLSEASA